MTYARSHLHAAVIPTIEIRPNVKDPRQEGENLLLECHAQASPPPLINWLRNGRPLAVSTVVPEDSKYRTFYSEQNSNNGRAVNILVVERLIPGSDDGEYTCRLENTIDPSTNVSFKANVTIIIQRKSLSVYFNCCSMFSACAYHLCSI